MSRLTNVLGRADGWLHAHAEWADWSWRWICDWYDRRVLR